ncbi:MAG: helix-turn-helix domain-containing protein [Sulfuricellaceae bacterium]|jgi:excisionase family DNA binding protein
MDKQAKPPAPSAEGALCSPGEAAKILGVSPRTIQSWVDNGILTAWKTVGGHRRITLESVNRLKKEGVVARRPATSEKQEKADDIYLARQPILDRRQRIVAYELLYRSGAMDRADIGNPVEASSRVITYAFSDLGIGAALGSSDCFINVDQDMLMSDVVELLPRGSVTLDITDITDISDSFIARCQQLRGTGLKLAIGSHILGRSAKKLLPHVDTIKISLTDCDAPCLERVVKEIRDASNIQLLAEKVETAERFQQCLAMGFDFFQGYYFARPHLIVGKRIHPSKAVLLQLLNLVMSEAPNSAIEHLLKSEPNLCYNLFRLVNSVAMGINRRISTVNEVVTILGRRQLQRWAHLLLFAQQEGFPYPSPLLQTAALRGELMRKLATMAPGGNSETQEHAFIAGIMSLLDALLGIPMEDVLENINVGDDVHGALLSRQGFLGRLLLLCETLEEGAFEDLPPLLDELKLDAHNVMQAQVEALQWVNAIGESIYA